jgi:hypothetical protein
MTIPDDTQSENQFTPNITRYIEKINLPYFRDDYLEDTIINPCYKKPIQKQQITGIEGIDLPLENQYQNIIENFESDKSDISSHKPNQQWSLIQYIFEIIAILLLVWFIYGKYLS